MDRIIQAILEPAVVLQKNRRFAWTIAGGVYTEREFLPFAYGRLTRFRPTGTVPVLDTANRIEVDQIEPNLIDGSSPFVYLPTHAAIAHLQVWNKVPYDVFMRRLSEVVVAKHDGFFAQMSLETICDLRTFVERVDALDGISDIRGKVTPPNPLFGPLWEELKEYLQSRSIATLYHEETAAPGESIETGLPGYLARMASGEHADEDPKVEIGDAIILMAIDGYGDGSVSGREDGEQVQVNTRGTAKTFRFNSNPEPQDLFREALRQVTDLETERELRHPDELDDDEERR